MAKFVEADRDQPYLLPPDLRDWIPADDLVHFVVEAVERVSMSAFEVNERGTGSAQYHPRMMLALLVYCYANGVFGSRRIERATYRDLGVRYLTADCHPDHDTICAFRRRNVDQPDGRGQRSDEEEQAARVPPGVQRAGGGTRTAANWVLGARVSTNASDRGELAADMDAVPAGLGTAERVLADNGYATGSEVAALEGRGLDVLVVTGAEGGVAQGDAREAAEGGEQGPLPVAQTDGGAGVRDRQASHGIPAVPAAGPRQGGGRVDPGHAGLQLPAAEQPDGRGLTGCGRRIRLFPGPRSPPETNRSRFGKAAPDRNAARTNGARRPTKEVQSDRVNLEPDYRSASKSDRLVCNNSAVLDLLGGSKPWGPLARGPQGWRWSDRRQAGHRGRLAVWSPPPFPTT